MIYHDRCAALFYIRKDRIKIVLHLRSGAAEIRLFNVVVLFEMTACATWRIDLQARSADGSSTPLIRSTRRRSETNVTRSAQRLKN
ncbi:hypothetical protein GPL21_01780 [Bradyrhizobium pachyrhizi]|uniref:Transposase n=1 Tax=Bradyrhizobium pachyrhizi TaxID=280333 RepID=A0A844SIT4_9BRAD|nr:hypothetical protein [Bradyrhizobium pachyrhizi]MVT63844.1 hypothetical protein [Bradyrhizobium pachyrhizi]WFU57862.1 hypothetical protein QA639_10320 [Bradyrhizobium pachyrhizi]